MAVDVITDVVLVRGTSEPMGGAHNMLTYVASQLDRSKYRVVGDLSFPASVGPVAPGGNVLGSSENESVEIGVDNLVQLIESCENRVAVLGYSLGAVVVSRFNEAQSAGKYADCEVAFTATVANPLRCEGDSIDPGSRGFGINGQHGQFPARPHFEVANEFDAITSCPADSPLRNLADVMSAFSFAEVGGWTEDLIDRLLRSRWQPGDPTWWLHPVRTWQRYNEAAQDVVGYLTGQHSARYITGGYCDRLAAVLNDLSR